MIWILFSVGVLLLTHKVFSFRKITKKVKKEKAVKKSKTVIATYKPLQGVYTLKAECLAFRSLLKLELKSVFKSLPFIAVMLMWLFIVFSELYATAVNGGEYGVSVYPYTNQLIALIVDPLTIFSLILIIFYSAEIVWRERHLNFNLIVDAAPVKNSVFFLSKFFALLLLPITIIASGIIMCVVFQIALNYSNFEFSLYASLFYHYGIQLAVFSMIALFVNSLAKNKYMGMGIFGLIVVLALKADLLGLEHPLTSIGFMPRVSYSNMNGFYGGVKLFNHLALYWLALGLLLIVLSFKIWSRGAIASFTVKIKTLLFNWTKAEKLTLSVLILLFISFGSLVFYNTNVISDYETISEQLDIRENYERKFKKYDSLEKPYPMSKKTEVAIYPKEKRYTVNANYILENKSDMPLYNLLITERLPLETIEIENATLITHNAKYGTYEFEFPEGLQPYDSITYTFQLTQQLKGYEEDNSIVDNGTYITHRNFEPILGYRSGFEIANRVEREKRNLPKRLEDNDSDAHIAMEDIKNEKIRFETIISTNKDQTVLSSGELIKQWNDGNRSFSHYRTKDKVLPTIAYFSAKYASKKINYNGIAIEQYYDKNHMANIETIENSIKTTLNYCQEQFGTYNFNHVRIAELPSHWGFGGFAHPGMISMVEDRLYLSNITNDNTFNLVAKRTIHEVAHQWWGHTLSVKPVPGGSLFVEGFAKYTEAVVMEKSMEKVLYTHLVKMLEVVILVDDRLQEN